MNEQCKSRKLRINLNLTTRTLNRKMYVFLIYLNFSLISWGGGGTLAASVPFDTLLIAAYLYCAQEDGFSSFGFRIHFIVLRIRLNTGISYFRGSRPTG